jgi:hypothetical protein
MVEAGYNFMKREHYYDRLPMAIDKKPTFVSILNSQSIEAISNSIKVYVTSVTPQITYRQIANRVLSPLPISYFRNMTAPLPNFGQYFKSWRSAVQVKVIES